MARYSVDIWCEKGMLFQKTLTTAYDLKLEHELLEEHAFSFKHSIKHRDYNFIKHQKIIRLADTTVPTPIATVTASSTTNKTITIATADVGQYSLNDYIIIFDDQYAGYTFTTSASTAGADTSVIVNDATGIAVGEFFSIQSPPEQGFDSEVFEVLGLASTTITTDLTHDYPSASAIYTPGRSVVSRILNIDDSTGILTLSRLDFAPVNNQGFIRKINFGGYHDGKRVSGGSFRIVELTEMRENGVPVAEVRCNHIAFDLNETQFFADSRVDISYGTKAVNNVIGEAVDVDTFMDKLLARHLDGSGNPLDTLKFIKGDQYRFYYRKGTVSTDGTSTITGDVESEFSSSDLNISGNSQIAIRDEATLFTIAQQTGSDLILTSAVSNTASGLEYFIVVRGVQISDEKVGTCNVTGPDTSKIVTNFSFTITGGDISHGARFQVEGDDKIYIVDYVTSTPSVVLTENIERSTGTGLNCRIFKDEREINISANVTLLGALKAMADAFTDERQMFWYEVGEDRAINIHQKPLPDDRNPTAELIVENRGIYANKNLKSLKKETETSAFGNRIVPLGSSSGWTNAQSGVTTTVTASGNNREDRYLFASNTELRIGDPLQIYVNQTTGTATAASQVTLTDAGSNYDVNEFASGLIIITSGEGKGQIRRIVTNTDEKFTVSRRWDNLPVGSNFVAARDIGNFYIRGWGYRKQLVKAVVGTDRIRIDGFAPAEDFKYRGGILTITSGTGIGQFYKIRRNAEVGGNSFFDIAGDFDPVPVVDESEAEVVALPQVVEEVRSGTLFNSSPNYVEYVPDVDMEGEADMFNGGRLYITSGSNVDNYTITDTTLSGSAIRVHVSTWTSGQPTDGDGILIINPHILPCDLTTGHTFVAGSGDTVSLLLKESGGPLTMGKYHTFRSTVAENQDISFTSFTVKSGEGGRFQKGQIIFVGAQSITSNIFFDLNRGNQIQGQTLTIASVVGDVITTNEVMNPVPQPGDHVEIISLHDNDEIAKKGGRVIEAGVNFSNVNDPKILIDKATAELDRRKVIKPRYEVGFIHLHELDPLRHPFDTFELGDTIRVIDDELGIDVSNIQVLRHEFDPSRPADVTNTIEVNRKQRRFLRDNFERINREVRVLNQRIDKSEHRFDVPKCIYWNDELKKCMRDDPPNYFCDSEDSAFDGRHTKEGAQITNLHCQAYIPSSDEKRLGQEELITEARLFDLSITSTSNTVQNVDVDFHVDRAVVTVVNATVDFTLPDTDNPGSHSHSISSDGTHDHGGSVSADGAHSHTGSTGSAGSHTHSPVSTANLSVNVDEVTVSMVTYGTPSVLEPSSPNGLGRGCRFNYAKTNSTWSTIEARVLVLTHGYRI